MSVFENCWEKNLRIIHLEEEKTFFSEAQVFQALKRAITSEKYLQTNFLKISGPRNIDLSQFASKVLLLNHSAEILHTQSSDELCRILKQIFNVDRISVYAKCLYAFFDHSIYEVGVLIEKTLGSTFKIPGSNLDLDIFFGDYTRSFNGIHRDGANLTFVYSQKEMLFWDFEVLEEDAGKLGKSWNRGSAKHSGSFFFPNEQQDSLFARIKDKARHIKLKKGDLIYWPTHMWHVAINDSDEVNLTLNLAMYKSDRKQFTDSLLHALGELGDESLGCNAFFDLQAKETFAEDEWRKLDLNFDSLKKEFLKSRTHLLKMHLSSLGIEPQALNLYRQVQGEVKTSDTEIVRLMKPSLFKIFYEVEDVVIRCYFFGETINLINLPSVIKMIDFCNESTEINLRDLLEIQKEFSDNKIAIRNVHNLFQFLLESPGVKVVTDEV